MSHEPVDLLILMLGTNDSKERFGCTAECISVGLERLIVKAQNTECWTGGKPNILVIAPPHILDGLYDGPFGGIMGAGCPEKSRQLAPFYEAVAQRRGCAFLDAEGIAEFNRTDCMHLTRSGHAALARKLAALVPQLVNGHE
jgi:lysophospholipase L1-like esterase